MSEWIQISGGRFNAQLHEYRDENDVVIPSVTQIGDSLGFTDFDNIPGKTLEHKQKLGDAVHYATHLLDTDQDLDWATVHPETGLYISAWELCKEELGITIIDSEVSGIGQINGMKFAYTRDRIVKLKRFDFRFVLELKCAYSEEAYWKYQTGFYEIATPRVRQGEHIGRIAIQLKPDGTFKPYLYENPRDKDRCAYLLAAMHIKIDEGVKWQKVKSEGL